jgi:hypothetical protein
MHPFNAMQVYGVDILHGPLVQAALDDGPLGQELEELEELILGHVSAPLTTILAVTISATTYGPSSHQHV